MIDLVAWTWEEVATKDGDARPAERYGHSATVVGEEAVWVFGGEDARGTTLPGDVFSFNLNTLSVRSAGWETRWSLVLPIRPLRRTSCRPPTPAATCMRQAAADHTIRVELFSRGVRSLRNHHRSSSPQYPC